MTIGKDLDEKLIARWVLAGAGICYDRIIYKQTYKRNTCIENNVNSIFKVVHSRLEIRKCIDSVGGV